MRRCRSLSVTAAAPGDPLTEKARAAAAIVVSMIDTAQPRPCGFSFFTREHPSNGWVLTISLRSQGGAYHTRRFATRNVL